VTSARIVVLGLALIALVLAVVVGFAWQALGDLFKGKRPSRPRAVVQRRRKTPDLIAKLTPERTKLRPYSPEILAVVLVALAAGLWLSRLLS
jgi:hypothetical protein